MTEHAAAGGTVVLATHDVELAARCAPRAIVLGDGEVVADGPARDVLAARLFAPQVLRVLPPSSPSPRWKRPWPGALAVTEWWRRGAAASSTCSSPRSGVAAFLYPFWLPKGTISTDSRARR